METAVMSSPEHSRSPICAGGGVMRAGDITPRPVEWLWWPYVPLGKITALAGQMGQAKSLLTVYMAASVSRGRLGRVGDVLMLNAEDDAEDTIRPRLEAAGADLSRVLIESQVELNAGRLGDLCDEFDVRLITIDPIQAYLPSNVDAWKGQHVRRALEPIRQLALQRGLAVVVVQHLNRNANVSDPLARIGDSQGITQLARSVLIWGPDPSDPDGDHGAAKALTRAKGNLARSKASATFTIVETVVAGDIAAPSLERGEDREIAAEDVIADRETRSAVDEATEWLRELLADGPVEAKEGQRLAGEVGISGRTLARARKVAGVRSEQSRGENGIAGWRWSLRDGDLPLATAEEEALVARLADGNGDPR